MSESTRLSAGHLAFRRAVEQSPPVDPTDVDLARKSIDALGAQFAMADGVQTEVLSLGGRPCMWFDLKDLPKASSVILYLHGGGFSLGSFTAYRHMAAEVCVHSKSRVALLDYRLAPEYRFPVGLKDIIEAYRELLISYPAARVAVAGDSAGAGLAASLLASLKAEGLPSPACTYVVSPFVDLEYRGESYAFNSSKDPMLTREISKLLADRYLDGQDAAQPLASPVNADFTGVSPILIQIGSGEALLSDAMNLALAAAKSDVKVVLDVWPEMLHAWPLFFGAIPEGRSALVEACEFMRTHLASGK